VQDLESARKYYVEGRKSMLMFARREIRRILTDTWDRQGWLVPDVITDYECEVLHRMLARVPWQPEPSYAERYMAIKRIDELIEFGDVCWFTRAVFPQCMERRGIRESYFTELGQSAWDRAVQLTGNPVLTLMRDHFEWTAEMAYTAIHSEGDFRSMWD
jgi:hypothetical protein